VNNRKNATENKKRQEEIIDDATCTLYQENGE